MAAEQVRGADVMYVGDSITDVQPLEAVRAWGGVSLSFNGNAYALAAAEFAAASPDAEVTAELARAFADSGREGVLEVVRAWPRPKKDVKPIGRERAHVGVLEEELRRSPRPPPCCGGAFAASASLGSADAAGARMHPPSLAPSALGRSDPTLALDCSRRDHLGVGRWEPAAAGRSSRTSPGASPAAGWAMLGPERCGQEYAPRCRRRHATPKSRPRVDPRQGSRSRRPARPARAHGPRRREDRGGVSPRSAPHDRSCSPASQAPCSYWRIGSGGPTAEARRPPVAAVRLRAPSQINPSANALTGRTTPGLTRSGVDAPPPLLLLDEPADGLDLPGREALLAAIMSLVAEEPPPRRGHRDAPPRRAGAVDDARAAPRAGGVVACGPVAEVLTDDPLSACFGSAVRVARHDDGRWSGRAAPSWER